MRRVCVVSPKEIELTSYIPYKGIHHYLNPKGFRKAYGFIW